MFTKENPLNSEDLDKFWETDPVSPSAEAAKRWCSTSVRPWGVLPLDDHQAKAALAGILFILIFLFFLFENRLGASQVTLNVMRAIGASGLVCAVPLVEVAAYVQSRFWGRAAAWRALRLGYISVMAQIAQIIGALAWVMGLVVRTATRRTLPKAWGQSVCAVPDRWARKLTIYAEMRWVEVSKSHEICMNELTEVGAWRLARRALREGCPELAAHVWVQRPFNPSWHMGAIRLRGLLTSTSCATGFSLVNAIKFSADVESDSSKKRYLGHIAGLMRSTLEGEQIRRAAGGTSKLKVHVRRL